MLSKNLVRQGFINHGLLLMIPATSMNADVHFKPKETRSFQHDFVSHVNPSDSVGIVDTLTKQTFAPAAISLNRNASRFVKNFLVKEDEFLQLMKARSGNYFGTIESILCRYDIPLQLKYLAVVESELRSNAVSRVGAKGLWQLMPQTAREMGLKVSGHTDERLQSYKSTVAAAKYLKALHAEFGDWLLVLAAYNGGPGTVYKAIKKAGSKNFWALQQFLPEESRGHVKRFISIHYFFEGNGSIATQTKSEAIAYKKKMEEQMEQMEAIQLKQISKDTVALVAVAADFK